MRNGGNALPHRMCVCEGKRGARRGNTAERSREGSVGFVPWHPPFVLPSMPCRGTLGGGFRVTVWVLSWIYKSFMSFSPPPPPSAASYTIHSPPFFHSRLHNHCTAHKGLSSQVQPRLARIKERFQLKMFFPSLFSFLFPETSSFSPPVLFSLFFLIKLIIFVHLHFLRVRLFSFPICLVLCQNKSVLPPRRVCHLPSLKRFCPL